MSIVSAPIYHDLQGLSVLRAEARNTPSNAIGEVAVQFESLFMQMMLKSMRDATASLEGGLFDSDQMEMYQQMFDQQVSLDLSRQGALGLSDILVRQLGGDKDPVKGNVKGPVKETENTRPVANLSLVKTEFRREVLMTHSSAITSIVAVDSAPAAAENISAGTTNKEYTWQPSSPEEFIRDVWKHAVKASQGLDLDPNVLVAQSALETGWGKKVLRSADGSSTFNMFGIKAGDGWHGNASVVNTVEYRSGVANIEKAAFRVYDSLASSFSDYVNFLQASPRYHQALEKVSDNRQFLFELQNAGYATDPGYAEKILDILGKSAFSSVVGELGKLQ